MHTPSKGDEYRHPAGSVEIVFAIEDGHVLTVTEYGSTDAFADAVADATYRGVDDEVAGLPSVEAFVDSRPEDDTGESDGDS